MIIACVILLLSMVALIGLGALIMVSSAGNSPICVDPDAMFVFKLMSVIFACHFVGALVYLLW